MPRESLKSKRERAQIVADVLRDRYPEAVSELKIDDDPFHLAVAVLLSAQTTDAAVNKVTPILWERYPTVADLASARQEDVEESIRTIGFFHVKAANAIKAAQRVLTEYGGELPQDIDELQKLPGIGRKTANIVMSVAFGQPQGIAVDTHVFRISHRLKLSNAKTPSDTEKDLMKVFPKEAWSHINLDMVLFGRDVCQAKKPQCETCPLVEVCPSAFKAQNSPQARPQRKTRKAASPKK